MAAGGRGYQETIEPSGLIRAALEVVHLSSRFHETLVQEPALLYLNKAPIRLIIPPRLTEWLSLGTSLLPAKVTFDWQGQRAGIGVAGGGGFEIAPQVMS